MVLERVANNQLAISLSAGLSLFAVERLIGYARYLEATSGSIAQQGDIDILADEVNTSWWNRNKQRFLK